MASLLSKQAAAFQLLAGRLTGEEARKPVIACPHGLNLAALTIG